MRAGRRNWRVFTVMLFAALALTQVAPAFAYTGQGDFSLMTNLVIEDCDYCHGEAYGPPAVHGGYSSATRLCASCHNTMHGAAGQDLLFQDTPTKVCRTCHDGSSGNSVYSMSSAGLTPQSVHGIEATSIVPGGAADGGDAAMAFKGADGRLTCNDCHSPHGQNTVVPYLHWRSRAGEPHTRYTSSDLLRRRPAGVTTPVAEYGSDWCLACHKGRGSGGMAHNHPVDSKATTTTPFTYADVVVGGTISPTPIALSSDGSSLYVADIGNDRFVQFNAATGTFVRSWPVRNPSGRIVGLTLSTNLGGSAARDLMSSDGLEPATAMATQKWEADGSFLGYIGIASGSLGLGSNRTGTRMVFPKPNGLIGLYVPANPWYQYQDDTPQDVGGAAVDTVYGATIDSTGAMYMLDYAKSRIAVVTGANIELENWDIAGYLPSDPLPVAGSAPGRFQNPMAIAIGPQAAPNERLYVADTGNSRIQVLTLAGAVVSTFGSSGGPGQLNRPSGIAVADDGTVYVADAGNQRIVVFSAGGAYLRTIGTAGSGDGQFLLEVSSRTSLAANYTDAQVFNSTHLMADPRLGLQSGHGPICQQCHENTRDPGTLVNGIPQPSTNIRERGWFPHESANPNMLIERADGLCHNCHATDRLP